MKKFRGGHRIGPINATIPLASLKVSGDELIIKSLFAKAEFTPMEVIAIEEVSYVPLIAQGIRIVHANPALSKTVIFWTFKDPQKILTAIKEAGFIPAGN